MGNSKSALSGKRKQHWRDELSVMLFVCLFVCLFKTGPCHGALAWHNVANPALGS